MFSNLSLSSISLATVTPSLVIRGTPNDLSITTLRPFGPRVTLTALARISTPRSMRSRASVWNFTSLAAISILLHRQHSTDGRLRSGSLLDLGLLVEDAEHIAFLHDEEILALQADFRAGPLAEKDAVPDLHLQGDKLALLVARTGAEIGRAHV